MSESLFTSQTPSVTNASDGTPGITRGLTIQFAVAGTVSGIRWWCPTTVTGNVQVRIYQLSANTAGSVLATKAVSGTPTGDAWNITTFDTPVSVDSTHIYRVTIFNNEGRYVATNSVFITPLVTGNLTAEASGATPAGQAFSITQGTFQIGASDALPTATGISANYFVDVVFTASGGGGTDLPVSGTLSGTGTLSGLVSGNRTVSATLDGTGSLSGLVSGGNGVAPVVSGIPAGWWGLYSIEQENRQYRAEAKEAPVACPYDGEPLLPGPHGGLYCPWGNYRYHAA